MHQPDENTVSPEELSGPSGKALEDWQAGGGDYPRAETFKETGYSLESGKPPARASDDPLAHTKLGKKGLAPSKAANPPVSVYDATAPEPSLFDATSDV